MKRRDKARTKITRASLLDDTFSEMLNFLEMDYPEHPFGSITVKTSVRSRQGWKCWHCGKSWKNRDAAPKPRNHAKDCRWRQARELIARAKENESQ